MPTPEQIFTQTQRLTADLISLSVCAHQNFPSLQVEGAIKEVAISGKGIATFAMKNISYHEIYDELLRTKCYNVKMLDGALLQIFYRFRNDEIEQHRLCFFPSPMLEEFQNNPEVYLLDEIYSEVVMKNIVPFPIRFDFDNRQEVVVNLHHPKSHLTLGQYKNCRIPVTAPLSPYQFFGFILRSFYNTGFKKFCDKITVFEHEPFLHSITHEEQGIIHMQLDRVVPQTQ